VGLEIHSVNFGRGMGINCQKAIQRNMSIEEVGKLR